MALVGLRVSCCSQDVWSSQSAEMSFAGLVSTPLTSEATVVRPGACLSQLLRYSSLVALVGLSAYDDEPKPTVSALSAGDTSVPCEATCPCAMPPS